MQKPNSISKYPEVDLKLGIKSSLRNVKSTLALLLLLWRAMDGPAELAYAKAVGDSIEVSDEAATRLTEKYNPYYGPMGAEDQQFINLVNTNQMLEAQIEPLLVAFELIWRVAKIRFDGNMAFSYERTGTKRYPKTVSFTKNMDILDMLITSDEQQYSYVLLKWVGLLPMDDNIYETRLLQLLTVLSEETVYKMADGERDLVFQMNNVYEILLAGGGPVDIDGTKEVKGPTRILKSSLSENMNRYVSYKSKHEGVAAIPNLEERLRAYQKRVDAYLSLTSAKHLIGAEPDIPLNEYEEIPLSAFVEPDRLVGGQNVILYGVPGSGKSYAIEEQYCSDESRMERLVFHPDYTYSDFVGQILPTVTEGNVSYEFVRGPFTRILQRAQQNPGEEYFLIIEEINRGNAPAIFGEIFQLLDRDADGTSEYGITNADIARAVYLDESQKVRIPSNLSIIGTMNTSDQNVFTLDTAFQRRWEMRMIENDLNRVAYADQPILDTDITWRAFNAVINETILRKNVRMTSSEDKRLGAFFVREADIRFDQNADDSGADMQTKRRAALQNSRFAEKVLKYLWDDAFKLAREDVFDMGRFASLEEVVRAFCSARGNARFQVLKEGVVDALLAGGARD